MSALFWAALYAVVLWTGWAAAWAPGAPARPGAGRPPWATLAALLVVGVPSLLQLTVAPGLLGALQRTPTELADGQLWRLVTSLVVQDGGWPGAVFNLAALAVVGATAEQVWGPRRWLVVWAGAGVGAQLWGLLVQPTGAGNSVATFGLAASVSVLALRRGRGVSRLCGSASLLAGLALLVMGDVHGGAVVLGALAGLLLTRVPASDPAGGRSVPSDPTTP
ncbi:rhomboid family intramembrane serine protease [Geodermatophilus sp. TF02-6]|uniref:rhomboid family intramembrane serine protease n=1 Tax=Geodermatophilus sp. TF02-6 TaxID=2250575 RepID=UPI001314AE10|nr:rhomboid family intramembrane serine protease [Geodermatophilus sp. TF02-6]